MQVRDGNGNLSAERIPEAGSGAAPAMGPLAIMIANRWMRGWPKVVKMHLASGEYLGFLKDQEEKERRAHADPTTNHLARNEIAELYDLSPKPPMPGP